MDAQSMAVAQNDATFFYPAVPQEALADQNTITAGFRRALGRERLLQLLLGTGSVLWLWSYVRGRQQPASHRRRKRARRAA